MKKHFFRKCMLLLCPFFGQQLAAQTVTWQPEILKQNQKISFQYQPKGGDLEFSDGPKALAGVYSGSKWNTVPVQLEKKNDVWTGSYQLPEHAVLIALKFYQGDLQQPEAIDNQNGKGYYHLVKNTKGQVIPGSYLAEAAFKAGTTGNGMLSSFIIPSMDKKMIDSLLQQEKKLSKRIPRSLLFNYLDLKQLTMPASEFSVLADNLLKSELKNGNLNEQFLAQAQRYYDRLKDKNGSAAVESLIFKDYPKSSTARFLSFRKYTEGKYGKDFETGAEDFLKAFPYLEWKKSPDNQAYIYYTIFRNLATQYFDGGQNDKFLELFKDIDFKTANEIYRWNISRNQMAGKSDQKLLYNDSRIIIPYLLERQKDKSYSGDFDDAEKAQENADNQMDDRLFTHIALANAQGDYAGANQYFKYLSKKGTFGNADLNAMHVNVLEKLNDTKAIKALLESSVAANAVTPVMFTKLKELYKSEHGGKEDGYEQYLVGLTPSDKKNEMRAHVMANMVNYPLAPFSLENADGKMVNSKDWANQIVVIDFWATWCRPCIEAFPGMQLLIDQYAKDPKVAVYMIGTMQFGDYKAKSVNYVKSQGFRFNLLHDAISQTGSQDQVFKSLLPLFKQSSIPRKIIVKNGVVRYSSEGYSGSPSQLRDELSTAIEILRAEK
ncbi:TlpA family protein disulfide reductase [Pedobacter sp. KBS0701]|uniref:TlpA family protein disulfide reductase n=1 Tax=Pedobacter sp. KBS0701 TaxID=2578106 RepID=UPI00110F1D1F|nr:TlpA disulfide reductase family protein [Pedobacter sp. KBS0701]QDW26319.1 TlpA family protein disulfide reductase [Pedobacter sp. KBS0701]